MWARPREPPAHQDEGPFVLFGFPGYGMLIHVQPAPSFPAHFVSNFFLMQVHEWPPRDLDSGLPAFLSVRNPQLDHPLPESIGVNP